MECLKIKEEYQAAIVGFNNSGLPLGKRTDLHLLAQMAQYDKSLQKYFERMPDQKEIDAYKEELFLASHPE
jgi:hypothetical protein